MGPGLRRDGARRGCRNKSLACLPPGPRIGYSSATLLLTRPSKMFPNPQSILVPNPYGYESEPMVKATGFREYDARWLFGTEINLMGIQALGMGLGALIRELGQKPEIVTGHDFRGYSSSIKYALMTGLMAAGCEVHD